MNKEEAQSFVAILLAVDTARSVQAALDTPSLQENTRLICSKNRDVAIALDIDSLYSMKLEIHLDV